MATTKEERECIRAHQNFRKVRNFAKDIKNCVWTGGDITLPDPPPAKEITNYGLPKKERKFPYYEKGYVENLVPNSDEYNAFVEQEDYRRFNGFWFYNGDNLEYVTGKHYMTLQYWYIPVYNKEFKRRKVNKPLFRDKHRDWFYACDHIRHTIEEFGIIYYGQRRDGKTVNAISYGFWDVTENFNSHFAIQSKKAEDAEKVLGKIVDSWKMLPEMYKPIDKGYTNTKRRLDFSEETKKQGDKKTYREVLNSSIEAYNSTEAAIDGIDANIILHDEVGKTPKINVFERWNIAKQTISTSGGNAIGFGMVITTVEEMDKGGGMYASMLWYESKNSSTGLVPLFFPACYGMEGDEKGSHISYIDEWGYSQIEEAEAFRLKVREKLKGNALLSEMRKYPLQEQDMFINPEVDVPYPVAKIQQQIEHNALIEVVEPLWIKGNLYRAYANSSDFRVIWQPNENGRFMCHKLPPEREQNRYETYNGEKRPFLNNFCIGIDPFDHAGTVGKRHSNGSALVIAKPNTFQGISQPVPTFYYCARPDPLTFFDDMINLMVFHSSEGLIENQKYGLVNDMERLGYGQFAAFNPLELNDASPNRGIATTGQNTRNRLINNLTTYMVDHVGLNDKGNMGYFPFTNLLKEYLIFESDKWTAYDGTVASMLAVTQFLNPTQVFTTNVLGNIFSYYKKKSGY